MIQKPDKPAELVESYRPISLLPVLSKLFEKFLLSRLLEIIERKKVIPNHQFGFRHRYATIKQIHRIVKKINTDAVWMQEGIARLPFSMSHRHLTKYSMQACFTKSKVASHPIYTQS